ncbi:unnamed protein product [Bursaphelenchus xylophilus]|uniref:(pine wood nematode) hypothetical protein n=1 Tax=Bursaphelenchus xylophilus TaxID=6326 RepID=A0A1I7SDZ5_BURXY|nr:unnamed protein product [Bursaphelenchus xylophilus]CAG9100387.1 unnamed protein product [Bursaphelenchus xylophilus]
MVLDPTVRQPPDGLSLNQCLHKGRADMPTVFAILLRVRTFKYLVAADIEKAFLQIGIAEEHRPICRWLLPREINKPLSYSNIKVFEFCRLAFGMKPSPFMLQETIKALFKTCGSNLGLESLKNIYVDNLYLEANSHEEAQRKAEEARQLLLGAKMNLREFLSNGVLNMPEELRGDPSKAKVLGITWDISRDVIAIKLPKVPLLQRYTRADLLSTMHSPYLPLGLIDPLLVDLKRLFQETWALPHRDWHRPLPQQYVDEWLRITASWREQTIEFPRYTPVNNGDELHLFADASDYAIGAVAYIVNSDNRSAGGHIVAAKGQIVPKRKVINKEASEKAGKTKYSRTDSPYFTIPQAEAAGAKMACGLGPVLRKLLEKDLKIYFWGDNTSVLQWIQNGATDQPLVIRNILKFIWNSEVTEFGYVPTEMNPADIISRGTTPDKLNNSSLWRFGPQFLQLDPEQWPPVQRFHLEGEPQEADISEGITLTTIGTPGVISVIQRVYGKSSWPMAVGAIAQVLRVADLIRLRSTPGFVVRDQTELRTIAMTKIHLLDQQAHPPTEEQRDKLRLFKDSEGVFRSRGRIGTANLPYYTKYPIFIHQSSPLAKLILRHAHERMAHQGARATLCWSRRRYWIPKPIRSANSAIKSCCVCSQLSSNAFPEAVAEALPRERITRTAPFENVGVDAFGPYMIKAEKGFKKRWGIIFTCATTRAIHLEVVDNMSAKAFLEAFLRFKSVRGIPNIIISDNGTNFTAAAPVIIHKFAPDVDIRWKFIDPGCPWKGGFYERLIGMVKRAFQRLSRQFKSFSDSQFITLLKEVEDAINHRPLFRAEETPDDFSPLRPVDFLRPAGSMYVNHSIGVQQDDQDTLYVPKSLQNAKKDCRKTEESKLFLLHQSLLATLNNLWSGWSEEYLLNLRQLDKGPKDRRLGQRVPSIGESVHKERICQPLQLEHRHHRRDRADKGRHSSSDGSGQSKEPQSQRC